MYGTIGYNYLVYLSETRLVGFQVDLLEEGARKTSHRATDQKISDNFIHIVARPSKPFDKSYPS